MPPAPDKGSGLAAPLQRYFARPARAGPMPRPRALALLALCLLLAAPLAMAASYSRGPFAGVITGGAWKAHAYANHADPPVDAWCPAYPWGSFRPYRMVLTYEPPTDRLDLNFAGKHAAGRNGLATLTFDAYNCLRGDVWVGGIDVAGPYAAYQLTIIDGVPIEE